MTLKFFINHLFAVILFIFFIGTFFNSLAVNLNPIFKYIDEIFVLIVIFFALTRLKIRSKDLKLIALTMSFGVYVLCLSLLQEYFVGFFYTFVDIFILIKAPLLFIALINLDDMVFKSFTHLVLKTAFLFVSISFFIFFIDLIFDIVPSDHERFGISSFYFLSNNPGEFLNLILISGILISVYCKNSLVKFIYIIFSLILLVFTLRYKAFVLALFWILLIFRFKDYSKYQLGTKTFYKPSNIFISLFFIVLFSIPLGYYQFSFYFLENSTPRLMLTIEGLNAGIEHFPFGMGAGTFGSAVANLMYSPYYYELGFDKFYGLNPDEPLYLSDSFWPSVFAQYGFIGVILVLMIYFQVIMQTFVKIEKSGFILIGFLVFIFSLIISTVGSFIISGPLGMIYIIGISIFYRNLKYD